MKSTHARPRAHPKRARRSPLGPVALLASALLAQSALAAPAGPLRLAPELSGFVDGLTADINALVSGNFTHIIVGGGNSGLALAGRLSEDSSTTVLVIEAGTRQEANTGIIIPAQAGSTFGSDIDWAFFTTPQVHANNRKIFTPRGKVLGGSTALNFMAWTRGFAPEYAAWSALAGSPNWTYNKLLPFFKKSEKFHAPGPNNQNVTRKFDASAHGTAGPVDVSYPPFISQQFTGFFSSMLGLGVTEAQDLNNGKNQGVSWSSSTVDPAHQTRETSETAYISPIAASRPNLVILTSAQATGIVWADQPANASANATQSATGVEFVVGSAGQTFTASASGEVILSAGSIQSPQLLELSGVGDPKILGPLGIETVVNLPGVGANLQDHPAVVNVYKLKPGFQSLDTLTGTALAAAVAEYALGKGILTQELSTLAYVPATDLLTSAEQRTALGLAARTAPFLPKAQQVATAGLLAAEAPLVELLPINVYFGATQGEPNTSYISLATCLQHSFSRGTVHITSSNPLTPPAIDPNYLAHPFDAFVLQKGAQFLRKATQQPAFAAFIQSESEPGPAVQTDAQFAEWVKGDVRTEYHPVGTASMLPRSQNGVVDPQLKVYGTSNVRVVDLSVLPLHLSTHPQSVAYAIAEAAAPLILAAN